MFSVIFEVHPKPEQWDAYLGLGKMLKPELEQIDGFVDNIRYRSLRRDGWLLSLSGWRDEKALVRWRTDAEHHRVQERGRSEVFEDYRLRVGEVTFDSDAAPPVPNAQQRFDETQASPAKVVSSIELTFANEAERVAAVAHQIAALEAISGSAAAPIEFDAFDSIYQPTKACLLLSWRSAGDAQAWRHDRAAAPIVERRRIVRVIRDYGMRRREEAPQYHPAVD